MAVEARHVNLLPPQLITNRNLIKTHQGGNGFYNTQMDAGLVLPQTMPQNSFPFYQSVVSDPFSGKTSVKADSGLSYNVPATRKRSRDSLNEMNALPISQKINKVSPFSQFLDQDIISQLQQQQTEIDFFIAQQAEKVRLEMEEKRKTQTRMLVSAIQEAIAKRLKEKDEEIQRMGRLNFALQERVRSLCHENQLWRDLAQTTEATANSLRSNLEQVLAAQVIDGHRTGAAAAADDAASSCGSSDYGREDAVESGCGEKKRMCKKCGVKESSVLLLPCRHLCLCTMCGSTVHTCPVCKSFTNASVHVNMS